MRPAFATGSGRCSWWPCSASAATLPRVRGDALAAGVLRGDDAARDRQCGHRGRVRRRRDHTLVRALAGHRTRIRVRGLEYRSRPLRPRHRRVDGCLRLAHGDGGRGARVGGPDPALRPVRRPGSAAGRGRARRRSGARRARYRGRFVREHGLGGSRAPLRTRPRRPSRSRFGRPPSGSSSSPSSVMPSPSSA